MGGAHIARLYPESLCHLLLGMACDFTCSHSLHLSPAGERMEDQEEEGEVGDWRKDREWREGAKEKERG